MVRDVEIWSQLRVVRIDLFQHFHTAIMMDRVYQIAAGLVSQNFKISNSYAIEALQKLLKEDDGDV